jgi:hypothetical protein
MAIPAALIPSRRGRRRTSRPRAGRCCSTPVRPPYGHAITIHHRPPRAVRNHVAPLALGWLTPPPQTRCSTAGPLEQNRGRRAVRASPGLADGPGGVHQGWPCRRRAMPGVSSRHAVGPTARPDADVIMLPCIFHQGFSIQNKQGA